MPPDMRIGICDFLLRSDLINFRMFRYQEGLLDAMLEVVEVGLECWAALAIPAVSNPVLLADLEKNVVENGADCGRKGLN